MLLTTEDMQVLLEQARVIAVVGHSDDPHRTSYRIARYLRRMGYIVYPVNPTVTEIDGQPSYPNLAAVPQPIDIVNVFRRAEHLAGIVQEAIEVGAGAVWGQLTVESEEAARLAEEAGLPLIMNNCIKVTHGRLI